MTTAPFMEDALFPVEISHGSIGGPDWPAEIVPLASNDEERNTRISTPLRTYDAKFGIKTQDELHEVLSLYFVAMGRLKGFRYKDWADYRSCPPLQTPTRTDQAIGSGDGATATFQLVKTYRFASGSFVRTIKKPVAGSVLIAVDGSAKVQNTDFTVDTTTGIVTFLAGHIPANGKVITAGYEFHVPVRFDCKLDQATVRGPQGDIPSIFLKELKRA